MNLKKIKKKDICLFSAPHYFLNHLKNKQNSVTNVTNIVKRLREKIL